MPGPNFSTLSPTEVWRAAFDDATQTLRTSLQAAIVGVQQEVKIDAADDSVVVFQPTGASLHVFVDNFASLSISVAAGSTVTVTNTGFTAFQGTNPWVIGGTVTVANPSSAGATVTVANAFLGVTFAGVTILNFPAVQAVTFPVFAGPVGITGVLAVTFPPQSAIGITGPVGVTFGSVGVTFGGATILNFPAIQGVTFGAAGTITQAAILVSTTAVRLTVSGAAPSASRTALIAEPDPNSGSNFYVGSNTVGFSGPTRGILVAAGDRFIANNDSGDYYIVSDGSTQTVFVLEKG